jgi:hypothetical protein
MIDIRIEINSKLLIWFCRFCTANEISAGRTRKSSDKWLSIRRVTDLGSAPVPSGSCRSERVLAIADFLKCRPDSVR